MRKTAMLGVNIDHVATIRQARGTAYPSVMEAACLAIEGGADQITVHLREDRRHIQDRDVYDLKKAISVPLNLEMAAATEIVNIAIDLKPHTATLVPEKREELTTEGGLDCVATADALKGVIARLREAGIVVSLFIDPERAQIEMAKELGAEAIELHTGTYCDMNSRIQRCQAPLSSPQSTMSSPQSTMSSPQSTMSSPRKRGSTAENELEKLKSSAVLAKKLGLKVCAGHGLNYDNTAEVVSNIPEIVEYNIGHAIVARAVFVGLKRAVEEMKKIIIPPP